jgi:hypothetical protein
MRYYDALDRASYHDTVNIERDKCFLTSEDCRLTFTNPKHYLLVQ